MPGRHLQPDHSRGDPNTIGGYMAVHDRPAAFEGSDGMSYSVEIVADETGDATQPWAAYLLFVRWTRIGAQSPEGHVETEYLGHGQTEEEAKAVVGALSLNAVHAALEARIRETRTSSRRWYDVMRDDG